MTTERFIASRNQGRTTIFRRAKKPGPSLFLVWSRKHFLCSVADSIHIRFVHAREKRQRSDLPADALGVRELALAPAEAPVELEEVHRRIVHAHADAVVAHAGD